MKPLLLLLLIPFTTPPIGYRQLTWEDFKGKPPVAAQGDACTCTNIAIGYDTAYAIFIPERSWTKTKDVRLLRHEQLHFAVTRNYADSITWYLRARCSCSIEIGEMINKWRITEQHYDAETNHGIDTIAQKHWEELIKL